MAGAGNRLQLAPNPLSALSARRVITTAGGRNAIVLQRY